jgi:hypothetical protein
MNLRIALLLFLLFTANGIAAQSITGVWHGKVTRKGIGLQNKFNLELKLVKKGDSLYGTAYYYASKKNYYRYSVKGYFNSATNAVIWWDDQLIERNKNGTTMLSPNGDSLLAEADFNCPGGGVMMLDGKAAKKDGDGKEMEVHLDKTDAAPLFADEWDNVIDNYFVGGSDPAIIDSVATIAFNKTMVPERTTAVAALPVVVPVPDANEARAAATVPPGTRADTSRAAVKVVPRDPVLTTVPPEEPQALKRADEQQPVKVTPTAPVVTAPSTITGNKAPQPAAAAIGKLLTRTRKLVLEIPVAGDSVELRFYDNAEVDGDSISLFLNNRLLFEHVRLTANAYIFKLPVAELDSLNELVMVAENLGSIPPNTSLMIALVGQQRYEARLESTEQSSAMIRLRRERMIVDR